jgi:hypothetical protein
MPRKEKRKRVMEEILSLIQYAASQFTFAALGGLSLIVPLLIMVYVPGTTASVVTTCVSVVVFASQLAIWSTMARLAELTDFPALSMLGLTSGRFEPKGIVGATAAYAPVLVVFIGTSMSSSKS